MCGANFGDEYERLTTTFDEAGNALTESQAGVDYPAELTFECVNDFIHSSGRHFEELQCLCLGLITEIEKLRNT